MGTAKVFINLDFNQTDMSGRLIVDGGYLGSEFANLTANITGSPSESGAYAIPYFEMDPLTNEFYDQINIEAPKLGQKLLYCRAILSSSYRMK